LEGGVVEQRLIDVEHDGRRQAGEVTLLLGGRGCPFLVGQRLSGVSAGLRP